MLSRLSRFGCVAAAAGALLASVPAGAVAPPVLDTKSSSPVTVVTRDQLEKMPNSISLEELLKICPARTIPTVTGQARGDLTGAPASLLRCVQPGDLRMIDIYTRHNKERALFGYQPLRWNVALEATATTSAQRLALLRQLVHAPREGRGIERENLLSAPIGWSPNQMTNVWVGEKRYFHPGIYPNVCTGDWSQCAHYTQMIWPTTTDIGCGIVPGGGFDWLVCRYSPGGNRDGKPVGQPIVAANSSMAINPNATAYQWIDVKTGKRVFSPAYVPDARGHYHVVLPDAGDPDRAYDAKTGRNFYRDKSDGRWKDSKTGKAVFSPPYVPDPNGHYHVVLPDAGNPNRAFDPVTGRNFAKVPVTDQPAYRPERGR